jgi:threonine dehydrogenase-like Zn-dependent dehydrogenase
MSPTPARPATSRRVFLGDLSRTAADASLGSLVAGTGLRNAHAAGEDEIRVAVIGCGGRGTGATVDALSVPGANLKVVAMADVFPERLSIKKQSLAMEQPEPNPYRREWEDLVAAIVDDTPYNEAARGAEASLVTAMGRMAAHVGRTVTFDEALNWADDLTAAVAGFTPDSPAPVLADADGKYPVPDPGRYRFEYRS